MGGAVGGLPGALVGGAVGLTVGVFVSENNDRRLESKPVSDFNKRSNECEKIAKQEAKDAKKYGPSMSAAPSGQIFVITRTYGLFSLYSYTIRYSTLGGGYLDEVHSPNPGNPIQRIRVP